MLYLKVIDEVLKNPEHFVLKPQREGGGNNIYGADIPAFLETIMGTPEQDAYIVMDKITPPVSTNYMIRPLTKEPMLVKTISELGIFGYCIGDETGTVFTHIGVHFLAFHQARRKPQHAGISKRN